MKLQLPAIVADTLLDLAIRALGHSTSEAQTRLAARAGLLAIHAGRPHEVRR